MEDNKHNRDGFIYKQDVVSVIAALSSLCLCPDFNDVAFTAVMVVPLINTVLATV